MNLFIPVIVVIIFVIIWLLFDSKKPHVSGVLIKARSTVDGKLYQVQKSANKQDGTDAADVLANLNIANTKLIEHLKITNIPQLYINNLVTRYSNAELIENNPYDDDTSYLTSKRYIVMCLRDKNPIKVNGVWMYPFQDPNILRYVSFHELTHMALEETEHVDKFWNLFKFVLSEAEKIGIYKEIYGQFEYCGALMS
jgi:predicted metal-dependent hydrolase